MARKLQSVVVMLSSMETAEALRGVAAAFMTSDQQDRDAQAARDLWQERDVDGNLKEAEESMFPTWLAYPFIDLKNTILHPERYDEALADLGSLDGCGCHGIGTGRQGRSLAMTGDMICHFFFVPKVLVAPRNSFQWQKQLESCALPLLLQFVVSLRGSSFCEIL